ncbi:MAG TPA: tyrosine--tRNA ligase [Candidatus Paceibacterota bacterium]
MKVITDPEKIEELLTRGVDKIYPSKDALKEVLLQGKRLKLYQGFDPTGPKLHIGHMVGLKKLAQWQQMGHQVIFLVGDLTGEIGDPSGKSESRKMLSRELVLKNAENYKEQASKLLNFRGENPVEVKYNSEWLGKMGALDFLKIAGELSVQQVIKRDLFQDRIEKGQDLFMNEFLYPVMQAFDSVAMDVDLEIGGSDQTFNMLMGRKLMRQAKQKEKFVMTTKLLVDSSGKKIGKTEGNAIALDDDSTRLFGAIMAFPDEVVTQCFECLTDVPMEEIKKMDIGNPMANKKRLAFEIVKQLHDEKEAEKAQQNWGNTFQKKEVPEEMEEIKANKGQPLSGVLVEAKVLKSKSEWRRLVEGNGVHDLEKDTTITDVDLKVEGNLTLKLGKKKFLRILV